MRIKVETLKKLIKKQINEAEVGLTPLDSASDISALCKELKAMTARNDATGAVVLISQFTKNKAFMNLASAVEKIHDIEGSIPKSILAYRRELTAKMLKFIDMNIQAGASSTINQCL